MFVISLFLFLDMFLIKRGFAVVRALIILVGVEYVNDKYIMTSLEFKVSVGADVFFQVYHCLMQSLCTLRGFGHFYCSKAWEKNSTCLGPLL